MREREDFGILDLMVCVLLFRKMETLLQLISYLIFSFIYLFIYFFQEFVRCSLLAWLRLVDKRMWERDEIRIFESYVF